jgi:hypothetical protein
MNPSNVETHAPISNFLSRVSLGPAQFSGALTLWPLVSPGDAPPCGTPYGTLSAALAKGELRIDEVSEDGSVSNVRITNEGNLAVLFLFGEEIRGAKQNRVANASFLVSPKSEITIDVSCVEAGRWGRKEGASFEATEAVLSTSLRRKMAGKVAAARATGRGFVADQHEVWNGISERIARSKIRSRTQAYADYRASRKSDLESLLEGFRLIDGQVGFIASISGEITGLEAIGRPDVLAADYRTLLRSYGIDAIDAELFPADDETGRRFKSPEALLQTLAQADWTRSRSLGAGDDLRVQGHGLSGCALVHEDVVHMSVFPSAVSS